VFNRILQKLYQINSPDAVTLGGAYEGGAASPVCLQGHTNCCSGQ